MEIQPMRGIIPANQTVRRYATWGGAVGMLIPLIVEVFEAASPGAAIVFLASGAAIGGMAAAAAAILLRRRQGSFDNTEKELRRIRGLVDQRLIDAADYQRLKSRIIEQYSPSAMPLLKLWPAMLWGMFAGVTLPALFLALVGASGLIIFVPIAAGGAVLGALLGGGGSLAVPRLIGVIRRAGLPAPKDPRLLDR